MALRFTTRASSGFAITTNLPARRSDAPVNEPPPAASLGAALLLNSRLARLKPFFRTALFAPVVTTLVAVAVIWRYLLHTRYGLLNYGLGEMGLGPIDWLGDPRWAMPAIILLAVWKGFGYTMIIFIAGLLVWVPIGITIWVLAFLVGTLDQTLLPPSLPSPSAPPPPHDNIRGSEYFE